MATFQEKIPGKVTVLLSNIYMSFSPYPANIYLFKVNRNNRKKCEICSKLTIKTPERYRHLFVNFEHVTYLFQVIFLLSC